MNLTILADGGEAEAFVARPAHAPVSPVPGVLLFIDAIGLRPQIERMAQRIADWGYVVLVPNVLYRSGDAAHTSPEGPLDTEEKHAAFFRHAMPRVRALTPPRSGPDTAHWLSTLADLEGVRTPFGVVGYCMGARLAVRAACDHPDVVRACAGFHGGGLATTKDDSPHLGLGQARAEFLFGHADHDRSMTPADVRRLGDALDAADLVATNTTYRGAPHGYSMADTASYDEATAERSFTELRALLDRTLR